MSIGKPWYGFWDATVQVLGSFDTGLGKSRYRAWDSRTLRMISYLQLKRTACIVKQTAAKSAKTEIKQDSNVQKHNLK